MLKDMKEDAAHQFILTCQQAEESFQQWVSSMDEKDLRTHFKELADIRDHLSGVIEKVQSVLRG